MVLVAALRTASEAVATTAVVASTAMDAPFAEASPTVATAPMTRENSAIGPRSPESKVTQLTKVKHQPMRAHVSHLGKARKLRERLDELAFDAPFAFA